MPTQIDLPKLGLTSWRLGALLAVRTTTAELYTQVSVFEADRLGSYPYPYDHRRIDGDLDHATACLANEMNGGMIASMGVRAGEVSVHDADVVDQTDLLQRFEDAIDAD